MNSIKRNQFCAFTMAELLVIMIISGAVFLSVMVGVAMFRKYRSTIAGRIGRNSSFFADYCRLEGMVSNADSIKAADRGGCEMYYEGNIRYRLVEKDSALIAYAGDFRDTMLVKIAELSVLSEKEGFPTAGSLALIVVTLKGEELLLSFQTEQSKRNEMVMGMVEKENKYRMDVDKE